MNAMPRPQEQALRREAALARFSAQGLPTRRDEEWKYTDVAALGKRATLAPCAADAKPPMDAVKCATEAGCDLPPALVFVDGYYCSALSAGFEHQAGARLVNLAALFDAGCDLPASLSDPAHEHTQFAALNNAYAADGMLIEISPGARLTRPICLLYIASGSGAAIHPRNIVVAGENAQAAVIERYVGAANAGNFTNALTQLRLAPYAHIRHCTLVQEGRAAIHIAGIHAEQERESRLDSHSFVLGGRIVRQDITTSLAGNNAGCSLNGLDLLEGRQHADHHTRIDHVAPGCTSRELYRGILDGQSHGVFNGKVIAHQGANGTDAHQSCHHLLLSEHAEIDTKPQLEIFNDDVRCTHGATVGPLDEESLFYLRSRGIDGELAHSMLIFGFARDVIATCEPAVQSLIERLVMVRLPHGERIREQL